MRVVVLVKVVELNDVEDLVEREVTKLFDDVAIDLVVDVVVVDLVVDVVVVDLVVEAIIEEDEPVVVVVVAVGNDTVF